MSLNDQTCQGEEIGSAFLNKAGKQTTLFVAFAAASVQHGRDFLFPGSIFRARLLFLPPCSSPLAVNEQLLTMWEEPSNDTHAGRGLRVAEP